MLRRLGIFLFLGLLATGPAWASDAPATAKSSVASDLPRVQHWIGVAVENIPPAMARQLKLKKDQGLLVVAVLPGSPALAAGLQQEDLLVEVNGVSLSTQEQLARVVNSATRRDDGSIDVKPATLAYFRDGERQTVEILPAPRPPGLQVMGAKTASFVANAGERQGASANEIKTFALPNGATIQVGSGYQFNLNSSDATSKSIRGVMNKGQSIVMSQETDATGSVKNSLVVGGVTYEVTTEKLKDIPADVRPLAEQLLKAPPQATVQRPAKTTEDRIQELEQANKALMEQLKELRTELKSRKGS